MSIPGTPYYFLLKNIVAILKESHFYLWTILKGDKRSGPCFAVAKPSAIMASENNQLVPDLDLFCDEELPLSQEDTCTKRDLLRYSDVEDINCGDQPAQDDSLAEVIKYVPCHESGYLDFRDEEIIVKEDEFVSIKDKPPSEKREDLCRSKGDIQGIPSVTASPSVPSGDSRGYLCCSPNVTNDFNGQLTPFIHTDENDNEPDEAASQLVPSVEEESDREDGFHISQNTACSGDSDTEERELDSCVMSDATVPSFEE